jgi:hypothetical protein
MGIRMPKVPPIVANLEDTVRTYEEVIRSFENARARMQQRRSGAPDSVMLHIDQSLKLNERTLESLNRVLTTAREQLHEERSRRNGN